MAELITTPLKLLQINIELIAGKTTSAEIMTAPIISIPITMVTAVKTDVSILYRLVFTPVAYAKSSSKVSANIFE